MAGRTESATAHEGRAADDMRNGAVLMAAATKGQD